MKKRWLLAALSAAITAQAAAMLAACANDGETSDGPSEDTNTPVPAPVNDGGVDTDDGGDASICAEDCEYYPDECTEDALCSAGLFNVEAPKAGLDLRTHVHALAGRSPNDVWLAGTAGGVARFDGTSWKRSVTDTQNSFLALWLLEGAEIAFDDPRRLYSRGLDAGADASASAGGWALYGTATLSPQAQAAMRVEASWTYPGSLSLWIGGNASPGAAGLRRMRYSPGDGRFAVAPIPDTCFVVPCREVYGLHGLSADEVWAVGPRGAAFRVTDAESDTPTLTGFNTRTTHALHSVWASAPDDVWAVGSTGTVRRYRGDPRYWEAYDDLPTKQHLYAIAGSSPSDIWVAGDEGTVFHYDGTAWKRVKVAGLGVRRPRLDRIWIPSPGKVWIAGQGALVSLGGKP